MKTHANIRRWIPVLVLAISILLLVACGESVPTSEPSAVTVSPEAAKLQATSVQATIAPEPTTVPEPTNTPVPTDTLEPSATPEPTDTPVPTDTPEPIFNDPVILAEIEGVGVSVTDNFEWPSCQKAVFYWTASPGDYGSASLIAQLHNVETGRDMPLVNEFAMDVSGDGISGATLQPLAGGKYYFSTENTDEPWTFRVECQDGVAPIGSSIDLQGNGNIVTDNYELSACNKSVFVWNVEPSDTGTASLIVYLCKVDEERCPSLVNEFGMDLTEPLDGEALEPVSSGIYFLATGNTNGNPWSIRWECRD